VLVADGLIFLRHELLFWVLPDFVGCSLYVDIMCYNDWHKNYYFSFKIKKFIFIWRYFKELYIDRVPRSRKRAKYFLNLVSYVSTQ